MAFGITLDGFKLKTLADIQLSIDTYLRDYISSNLLLTDKSGLGNIAQAEAAQLAEAWLALEKAYYGFDVKRADEPQFVALAALTGTVRKGAQKGVVQVTITFTGIRDFLPGDLIAHVNGDAANRWTNRDAIKSTVGSQSAVFVSELTGALAVAGIGTLTKIAEPRLYWSAVTNATAATAGTDIETIEALKERRESELSGSGSGTPQALAAAIDKVAGVIDVKIAPDNSSQLGGHSYRPIIWDGAGMTAAPNDIAQAIEDAGPLTLPGSGAYSGTALNVRGESVTHRFDRAAQIPITVVIVVVGANPVDVKDAILARAATYRIDDIAHPAHMQAAAVAAGATEVTSLTVTSQTAGVGRIATFAAANITVNGINTW